MKNTVITEIAGPHAQEHAIEVETLTGSGAGGRILKGDVEKAI